jgi:hypothetical protein
MSERDEAMRWSSEELNDTNNSELSKTKRDAINVVRSGTKSHDDAEAKVRRFSKPLRPAAAKAAERRRLKEGGRKERSKNLQYRFELYQAKLPRSRSGKVERKKVDIRGGKNNRFSSYWMKCRPFTVRQYRNGILREPDGTNGSTTGQVANYLWIHGESIDESWK